MPLCINHCYHKIGLQNSCHIWDNVTFNVSTFKPAQTTTPIR